MPKRPDTDSLREAARAPISELESLRGWAITLVFLYHVEGWLALPRPGDEVSPLWAFIRAGHTGVSLFFVLSGFLLSRPFLVEGLGGPRVDVRSYYRRRALRILPIYLVGRRRRRGGVRHGSQGPSAGPSIYDLPAFIRTHIDPASPV
jgi:hypothetical protein